VTDPWREVAGYRKAVKALKGPLIVGGSFALLLILGGAFLASGTKNPAVPAAVSILGGLGVTSAGLYARAKAQLTSLLSTLRLELDKQKVQEAANLCPKTGCGARVEVDAIHIPYTTQQALKGESTTPRQDLGVAVAGIISMITSDRVE
jgi:hypothetical protein